MAELKPRGMLGERLVDRGFLTVRQLELAIREQKRTGAMLGEILAQLGLVTPQTLSAVLAEQGGVTYVDLSDVEVPPDLLALVPEVVARRLTVVPLRREGDLLHVAMGNIYNIQAISELETLTQLRVKVSGAAEDDIQAKLNEAYGERKTIEELIEEAIQAAVSDAKDTQAIVPVIRLVEQLLIKAIRDRATDLHIQPAERTILTRFRVDGTLGQGPSLPKAIQAAVISRLKILAEVNIAESRLPQDGKFQFSLGRRRLDVRASFLPTLYGEKVVLRFLDKTKLVMGLDQLGMPADIFAGFTALLKRPHGVILVTGPTGSGKTTTLYSALNSINGSDRCIVTVEDPIEYELPLIAQVQVNVKSGLTFANGLRSILRQDPDIILIGEIRDAETASIAFRAALTGHLVLTTLHANDPVGSLPRLNGMGLAGLELAASLAGILAQRLVKVNCPDCSAPYLPDPDSLAILTQEQREGAWTKGAGCSACGHTGIFGRKAIHDLLVVTPLIRGLMVKGASLAEIEGQARADGKTSLFEHALALAQRGIISLEEAVHVTVAEDYT
jgi:type IV pilus assembly protein PilB